MIERHVAQLFLNFADDLALNGVVECVPALSVNLHAVMVGQIRTKDGLRRCVPS